jgi:hypothetical protein
VVTATGVVETEYEDGTIERQEGDELGSSHYRPRDRAHRLVNVGSTRYRNVVVELKKTRSE